MISILSEDIYQSPQYELPGIGSFLLQGIAAGAVIYLLIQLTIILLQPSDTDKFVFIIFLPFVLVWGMITGFFQGLVIWACTDLAGHRLNIAARGALGVVVVLVILGILCMFLNIEFTDPLVVAVYLSTGVAYGLLTGSRPWRELLASVREELRYYYLID